MSTDIKELLRPSAAERWLNCPGSAAREATVPRPRTSYADEGVAFHQVVAHTLSGGDAHEVLGTRTEEGVLINLEMVHHAEACRAYAEKLQADRRRWLIEHELDLGGVLPRNGTADLIVLDWDGGVLHVVDWKYGQGVRVDARQNPQLLTYAVGAHRAVADLGDFDKVVLHIVQPRLAHASTYETTVEELVQHRDRLAFGVAAALDAEPEVRPGPWCKFCAFKAHCTALAEYNVRALQVEFEDLTQAPPAPATLSNAQLGQVLDRLDTWESWVKAVRERAQDELQAGRPVPGWKLVEGRMGNRAWAGDDIIVAEAAQRAGLALDQYMPRSLASVAALEKTVGKAVFAEKFGELVTRPAGKPVLAPESDKRPAVQPALEFEDLTSLDDILS